MRPLLAAVTAAAALAAPPGAANAAPACAGATAATSTTCVFEYAGGHLVYWAQNTREVNRSLVEDEVKIRVYNETQQVLVGLCSSIGYNAGCGGAYNMGARLAPGDIVRCTVTSLLAKSTQFVCG